MSTSNSVQYCRKVLRMVAELHVRGYQRIRIAPGMSPSGVDWRCAIAPASNILVSNGALLADWDGAVAHYGSGMENRYFDWSDAGDLTASGLANRFIERFPEIVNSGQGRDWLYAGWYVEMLHLTYPDALPIAYCDFMQGDLRTMPTTWGQEGVSVPWPPPGEAIGPRQSN